MESASEGTNFRTATIYPAAINTELLDTISDKGVSDAMRGLYRKYGIAPERIASVVSFAIDQPEVSIVGGLQGGAFDGFIPALTVWPAGLILLAAVVRWRSKQASRRC